MVCCTGSPAPAASPPASSVRRSTWPSTPCFIGRCSWPSCWASARSPSPRRRASARSATLLAWLLTRYVAPGSRRQRRAGGGRRARGRAHRALAAHPAGEVRRRSAGVVGRAGRRTRRTDHPHGRCHRCLSRRLAEARPLRVPYLACIGRGRRPGGGVQCAPGGGAVRDRGDTQGVHLHLPLLRLGDRRLGGERLRHGAGRRNGAAVAPRDDGDAAHGAARLHGAGRRAWRAGCGVQSLPGVRARCPGGVVQARPLRLSHPGRRPHRSARRRHAGRDRRRRDADSGAGAGRPADPRPGRGRRPALPGHHRELSGRRAGGDLRAPARAGDRGRPAGRNVAAGRAGVRRAADPAAAAGGLRRRRDGRAVHRRRPRALWSVSSWWSS